MEICRQEEETRHVDFDDLEPGEVFRWVHFTSKPCMKITNNRYVNLENGSTHTPPSKGMRIPVARLDACLVVKGEK